MGPRRASGSRAHCGVHFRSNCDSTDGPILDEIDRLNHNIEELDPVRSDRDRRVRSLGSARVADIDLPIRTVEGTARVEINHDVEIEHG